MEDKVDSATQYFFPPIKTKDWYYDKDYRVSVLNPNIAGSTNSSRQLQTGLRKVF